MNGYFCVLTTIDFFVLCFMCILTYLSETLSKKQKRGFFLAFVLIAGISALEVITLVVDGLPPGYRWLNITANYLGFGLSPAVCICLVYVLDRKTALRREIRTAVRIEIGYLIFIYCSEMWNQLDALTGLLNQNSYLKQTGGVRCKGGVLVVFDVDDFKQINDRYGHIQGDLCLAGIAECIKKSYANFGYCYRIGGDEFCVLLKNGGNEGRCKQEFLQRLQEKRGEIAFLPTVSYGSAPFSGEDIVKVKDRADQDMYQYKKERKNRKRLS